MLHKSGPWQSVRTFDCIFKHGKRILAHMNLLCVMLAISKLCIELLLPQISVCIWDVSLSLPFRFPRIWNIWNWIKLLNIYAQTYALWSFPIRVLHPFLFMDYCMCRSLLMRKCTLYLCWRYLYYTFYILFLSSPPPPIFSLFSYLQLHIFKCYESHINPDDGSGRDIWNVWFFNSALTRLIAGKI